MDALLLLTHVKKTCVHILTLPSLGFGGTMLFYAVVTLWSPYFSDESPGEAAPYGRMLSARLDSNTLIPELLLTSL